MTTPHEAAKDQEQAGDLEIARLRAKGTRSQAAVNRVLTADAPEAKDVVSELATYVDGWDDDQAGQVLEALADRSANTGLPPIDVFRDWLASHGTPEEIPNLVDCLSVDPPAQVTIRAVLSRAGSQKVVYRALWHISEQEIVLKRFIGEGSDKMQVILRELQIHPLSMQHPNVNVTHLLSNPAGEDFLAERYIEVLDDGWRSRGAAEASTLLHDIASALEFVHGRGLIHGDVKPDNIGYEHRQYLLCDFGICRPANEFSKIDVTPTGSLRTRAPELLQSGDHSSASDVWALGATVFNALLGRFPLYGDGETPPRASSPEERAEFETELAERAGARWPELVEAGLEQVQPIELRRVLASVMKSAPGERPSAGELVRACRTRLAPLVRITGPGPGLPPDLRIAQLDRYLSDDAALVLMPQRVRSELAAELAHLRSTPGLSSADVTALDRVAGRLR